MTDLSTIFSRVSRYSSQNDSESNQALYMAPKKRSQRNRESLSSIGNRPGRSMDGSSDDNFILEKEKDVESAEDDLIWNFIYQEIYDWQYECQTGYPYWWSPESKYDSLANASHQSRRLEDHEGVLLREIDQQPERAYAAKRRAMSDSFLADPSSVDEMAQMIAIQLLSSCFTLPMNLEGGTVMPKYDISPPIPDPRMISSLRMHNQYRYSPRFGHEARSTSPVSVWTKTYDGPQSFKMLNSLDIPTPIMGPFGAVRRRRRVHPHRKVTTDSTASANHFPRL
jgi:hypothetical protein